MTGRSRHDELRQLAEQATPGPWFSVGPPWNNGAPWINSESPDPHGGKIIADLAPCGEDYDRTPAELESNAAYIAAASPNVVLALLDEVAAAEARAADAERKLTMALDVTSMALERNLAYRKAAAERARADKATEALAELLQWASGMPDAGLTVDDPRYEWHVSGWQLREAARALLGAGESGAAG